MLNTKSIAIVPANASDALAALECSIADIRAHAARAHERGFNELAVRMSASADKLQQDVDITRDRREIRAEGYCEWEIARYVRRTYGR